MISWESFLAAALLQLAVGKKGSDEARTSNTGGAGPGGRNSFLTRVGGLLRREGFEVDLINKTLIAVMDFSRKGGQSMSGNMNSSHPSVQNSEVPLKLYRHCPTSL